MEPSEVQLALDDLAGSVREGSLAFPVGVGLKVMSELPEDELVSLVGPKGKHGPERTATRHGSRRGQVVLGGRKLQVRRPRVRSLEGRELPLRTYTHFASDDLLCERMVETMLVGLSTRRHRAVLQPTGTVDRSVSKSAVSRRFVARTRKALAELLARPVPEDLVVLMLDGVVPTGSTCLCALRIRADGTNVPLGLWGGASENAAVCRRALADLGERGLTAEQGLTRRDRRLQGAAQGGRRGARRQGGGPALPQAQAGERARPPARGRAPAGEAQAPRGVGARRRRPRRAAPARARPRARGRGGPVRRPACARASKRR